MKTIKVIIQAGCGEDRGKNRKGKKTHKQEVRLKSLQYLPTTVICAYSTQAMFSDQEDGSWLQESGFQLLVQPFSMAVDSGWKEDRADLDPQEMIKLGPEPGGELGTSIKDD